MFRAALTPPSAVLSGVEMGPPLLSCATRTTVHSLSGTMRSVSMILGVSSGIVKPRNQKHDDSTAGAKSIPRSDQANTTTRWTPFLSLVI
ncbi:hypothetical protein LSAT2_024471 [Lamellibrachia satsuma]|nr:hypothetical protein LSAT2_024471 [Lamellibrachia satsuma]